ncbi:MAG: DUF4465 domain-containing protein [Bacteroidales bacterium]|nr:DUF4465 domain-containing protein [Bacteroidales bacterium]
MSKGILLSSAFLATMALFSGAQGINGSAPQRVSAADDGFCFWEFGLASNSERTHFEDNKNGGLATIYNGYYNANNYYEPTTDKWTGFGYANYTRTNYNGPEDVMLCCNPYMQGATYGVACLDESNGPILMTTSSSMNLIHSTTKFTNTAWVKKCILEGDGINGPFEHGDKCGVRVYAYVGSDPYSSSTAGWIKEPIELVLADFTDDDESKWYIADDWRGCELRFMNSTTNTPINGITAYRFEFFSTKTHEGKITTPPYFCLACFRTDYDVHRTFIQNHPFAFGITPEVTKTAFEGASISYKDFIDLDESEGKITYEVTPQEFAADADFQTDNLIVNYEREDGKYIRPLKFTLTAIQNGFPYKYSCEVNPPVTELPKVTEYAYEEQVIPYSSLLPLNPANGPIAYEAEPHFANSSKCEFHDNEMVARFIPSSDGQNYLSIYFTLTAYQNGRIYTAECVLDWAYGGSVSPITDDSTIAYSIYSTDGLLIYHGTEKPNVSPGLYIVVRQTAAGLKSTLESF